MEYIASLPTVSSKDPKAKGRCKYIVADKKNGLTDLITEVIAQAPFAKGQFEFGVCAMLALREVARLRGDSKVIEDKIMSYHAPFHVYHLERATELTAADVFVSEHRRDVTDDRDDKNDDVTWNVSVAVSAFTAHKDLTTIVMEFRDEFPSFAEISAVLVGIRRLCEDMDAQSSSSKLDAKLSVSTCKK